MSKINAYDGDGHVEEWEGTFSDRYLEPAFRDRRPVVVETGKYGTDCWVYASDIPHAHRKPDSPRYILDRPDLPDAAKQRILWQGTARLYGFEPSLPNGGD